MTHAENKEDLPAMIEDARRGWLEVSLEYGHKTAEPQPTRA